MDSDIVKAAMAPPAETRMISHRTATIQESRFEGNSKSSFSEEISFTSWVILTGPLLVLEMEQQYTEDAVKSRFCLYVVITSPISIALVDCLVAQLGCRLSAPDALGSLVICSLQRKPSISAVRAAAAKTTLDTENTHVPNEPEGCQRNHIVINITTILLAQFDLTGVNDNGLRKQVHCASHHCEN